MPKRKKVGRLMGNAGTRQNVLNSATMQTLQTSQEFPLRTEEKLLFDVDDNNGFVISKRQVSINEDVLMAILTDLPPKDLLSCRRVCKSWCNIIDSRVWTDKLIKSPYKDISLLRTLPWHVSYVVLHKKILNRNFIKNSFGSEKFNKWDIKSNGGDKFAIETPPQGTEGDPPAPSCFVTSYHSCSKQQIIDLWTEGACPAILNALQPAIAVSEWYAGRWDCWAVYDIDVAILDSQLNILHQVQERKHCGGDYGSDWRKVEFTLKGHPSMRYIRFYHGGTDGQFWAGRYGSKMTCASVQLTVDSTQQ